jgi:hypothetical protein
MINFVNDWEYLETDFYMAFYLHLVAHGGLCKTKTEVDNKSKNFFQPSLANLTGSGASKKVLYNYILTFPEMIVLHIYKYFLCIE